MDIRKIRKLIDIMVEADLQAIEVKEGEQSIALTRRIDPPVYAASAPSNAIVSAVKTEKKGAVEKAPMVGVFYAAPSPNEPRFVQVGQTVAIGDKLGIIEAMKIMNPIVATQNGIIDEILVQNGEVVEFDQPLLRYRNV